MSGREETGRPKLRMLWHSVAPWIASGYGKTTREICTRLTKFGFEVLISAYWCGALTALIMMYKGI